MEYNKSYIIRYNLQLFANDEGGEKTEEPTTKKLNEARTEGKVAKSKDIPIAVSLIVIFLALKIGAGYLLNSFIGVYKFVFGSFEKYTSDEFTVNSALEILKYGIFRIMLIAGPFILVILFVAVLSNALQAKWKVTAKPLKPKLGNINPISGFKNMFSKSKLFELIKSIVKILILSYVIVGTLKSDGGLLTELYATDLFSAVALVSDIVVSLGLKISMIFLVIAFVDFIYQKLKFKKDMRMSKQEVKDEYKNSEGDPQVKGQIKSKMMAASQRRMMQKLPEADVVITNPTHLAVALRYNRDIDDAPVVIAKGADFLAEKIKAEARNHSIEIVENKPLARMLYFNVELDSPIPPELYQMVAEVLAFVYGLKGTA
ncbi:MAG: flagellar biosynthesis protein FlhB [Lachnospiraceae bacterium]|nr:flagellar biosynthesis protein FlhB [Lachnospiraceae bacterium]